MTAVKKIRRWIIRHWYIMIKRPTNGRNSLDELNETLLAISGNKRRVCDLVEKMSQDNATAKKAIEENADNCHRVYS